ncbi:MAG: DUF2071 domain-containing protein [Planctomycetota bacterium]
MTPLRAAALAAFPGVVSAVIANDSSVRWLAVFALSGVVAVVLASALARSAPPEPGAGKAEVGLLFLISAALLVNAALSGRLPLANHAPDRRPVFLLCAVLAGVGAWALFRRAGPLAVDATTQLQSKRWAFLRAEWRKLCLVTYAVEPARLEPLLPPGLELDLKDGKAFVSLVAFDFTRTRVLGIPWPGYRDFPEVNLRFYVREGEQRGVAFVREFVPRRLIAWIARGLYNEPYRFAPMLSEVEHGPDALRIKHRLLVGGKEHALEVVADPEPAEPPAESTAHFFKEHTWGYGTSRAGALVRYEVRHPVWATYPVRSHTLSWDWGAVYGEAWADLAQETPVSVVLAEGSPVAVSPW